mgnify:FL=1
MVGEDNNEQKKKRIRTWYDPSIKYYQKWLDLGIMITDIRNGKMKLSNFTLDESVQIIQMERKKTFSQFQHYKKQQHLKMVNKYVKKHVFEVANGCRAESERQLQMMINNHIKISDEYQEKDEDEEADSEEKCAQTEEEEVTLPGLHV